MKNLIALSFALLIIANVFSQKQTLSLNLSKNQSYNQNMVIDMTIIQDVNGQEMNIKMNISTKTVFKVLEVKDSTYEMKVSYENIAFKMNIGNQPNNAEIEKMMRKMTNAMSGKSFEISLSKAGTVKDIRNMDNIFSNLFDSIPQITPKQKEQFQKQMDDAYGGKSFKSNLEMISAIYPTYPIAKGDNWVVKNALKSTYNLNTETKYLLTDVKDKYYLITANSNIGMLENDSFKVTNGIPVKVNLSGDGISDIKIDKKTGWVSEAKIIQHLNGNTEIQDCEQVPGGMKIPMKMEITMTITE